MNRILNTGRVTGVATLFAAAMVFASACSLTCGLAVAEVASLPVPGPTGDDHAHHHGDSGESETPSHHSSQGPSCDVRSHPGSFIKGPDLLAPDLSFSTLAVAPGAEPSILRASLAPRISGRDHAPLESPPGSPPLFVKFSSLRI